MNVLQAIKAANAAGSILTRKHTFLIYGEPKTGKTRLVATIAKIPELKRIFWFDTENGIETISTMYREGVLTDEQVEKIILIKIPDTRIQPTAIETMLKSIASPNAVTICDKHGKVDCATCKKTGEPAIDFDYKSLTHEDAVVIDSMSQVGASALSAACLGKAAEYKPLIDDYGATGKWLGDLCTVLQAAQYCHIFAITHVLTDYNETTKVTKLYPLCGTRNFSEKFAKYFGNVIFTSKKLKQHNAISSTTADATVQTGSRLGLLLDGMRDPDLAKLLTDEKFFSGPTISAEGSEPKAENPGNSNTNLPSFLQRK